MTTFAQFATRCKMRYDFADQIQVRYLHTSGEAFDTWVSGEEVLGRLESAAAEERLGELSRLDWRSLHEVAKSLPDRAKDWLLDDLTRRAADEVEEFAGENPISEGLADAIRGQETAVNPEAARRQKKWIDCLQDPQFRAIVLELAWIQLEGSWPDEQAPEEPDDWV
jgi:hypothetical protein